MSDLIIRALVCLAFGACAAAIDWYVSTRVEQ